MEKWRNAKSPHLMGPTSLGTGSTPRKDSNNPLSSHFQHIEMVFHGNTHRSAMKDQICTSQLGTYSSFLSLEGHQKKGNTAFPLHVAAHSIFAVEFRRKTTHISHLRLTFVDLSNDFKDWAHDSHASVRLPYFPGQHITQERRDHMPSFLLLFARQIPRALFLNLLPEVFYFKHFQCQESAKSPVKFLNSHRSTSLQRAVF